MPVFLSRRLEAWSTGPLPYLVVWAALALVAGAVSPAAGQVLGPLIHQQLPNRAFGLVADTEYRDDFGQTSATIRADRFIPGSTTAVGQVVWWGFYGSQNQGFDPDPPASETFRIRFYNQVGTFPNSLPPADLLYEEVRSDVLRAPSGFVVSPGRNEYRYVVNLSQAFPVTGGTRYWVEVAQVGDVNSYFRWETADHGEYAFQNPLGSPWQVVAPGYQLAYELRIPEPASAVMLSILIALSRARRRRR